MENKDSFFAKDQGRVFKNLPRIKAFKNPVLKRNQVVIGQKRRIDHSMQVQEIHQGGTVNPVYNNGELIGVVYECSCGKVAQILFDFEDVSAYGKHAATG